MAFGLAHIPSDEDRVDDAIAQFFVPGRRFTDDGAAQLAEFAPFLRTDVSAAAPDGRGRVLMGAVALRLLDGEEMLRTDDEATLYRRVERYLGWLWHFRSHVSAHLSAYGAVPQNRVVAFVRQAGTPFRVVGAAVKLWQVGAKPPSSPFMVAEFSDAIAILSFRGEFSEACDQAEKFINARYVREESPEQRELMKIADRGWTRDD